MTLGQRASFWVAAAVVAHTIWTSAAPAMTYPLYAVEWGLNTTQTAAIFAIYPIVVVGMLICFGDLSDYIGRRATLLLGLAASFIGVMLFAVAPNLLWIYIGRGFMGIGVGLSAGPATAAMIEFSAAGQASRASAITAVAQSAGLALATLIGGALIEYAPLPTRLNFYLLTVIIALIFSAVWFLPGHTSAEAKGAWRPKTPAIPRELLAVFISSAAAAVSAFAIGAVSLSLGAQIARDLIGSGNVMLNGATLSVFAIASGATGIAAKGLSSRTAIALGVAASAVGTGLLTWSVAAHALGIFLLFLMMAGMAYCLMFMGGLGLINLYAPPHHRGGTLSALYLAAYLMQGGFALSLGAVAVHWNLAWAIDAGAVAILLLSLFTGLFSALLGPRRRALA
ncbi:MFS transporter [Acerihabitans sp. KWT182]|uniref:MFS transporter n=1 Tax=Acerihabitans sp. KWT182 TaxID=3157919 RepID=A0AAU7Q4N6_9GAMM